MKIICPECQRQISKENINVSTDIAFCAACNESYQLSELQNPTVDKFDINHPPSGVSYDNSFKGKIITASTRSPVAFFLVPFMLVWSGGSLGGIYGTQIASGEFNLLMSLFGIPFIIGSVIFWSLALMCILGVVRVSILQNECIVFTGIGRIGWYRRFTRDEISSVREEYSSFRYPGSHNRGIILEGKTRIKFGALLNEKRKYYVLNALKTIII